MTYIQQKYAQGGTYLTTIVLLWKVPNRHLEILTFTNKLLGPFFPIKTGFEIFETEPYLVRHVIKTEKRYKPQMGSVHMWILETADS